MSPSAKLPTAMEVVVERKSARRFVLAAMAAFQSVTAVAQPVAATAQALAVQSDPPRHELDEMLLLQAALCRARLALATNLPELVNSDQGVFGVSESRHGTSATEPPFGVSNWVPAAIRRAHEELAFA